MLIEIVSNKIKKIGGSQIIKSEKPLLENIK